MSFPMTWESEWFRTKSTVKWSFSWMDSKMPSLLEKEKLKIIKKNFHTLTLPIESWYWTQIHSPNNSDLSALDERFWNVCCKLLCKLIRERNGDTESCKTIIDFFPKLLDRYWDSRFWLFVNKPSVFDHKPFLLEWFLTYRTSDIISGINRNMSFLVTF